MDQDFNPSLPTEHGKATFLSRQEKSPLPPYPKSFPGLCFPRPPFLFVGDKVLLYSLGLQPLLLQPLTSQDYRHEPPNLTQDSSLCKECSQGDLRFQWGPVGSPRAWLTLHLVSPRTESCESPGPEETQQVDKGPQTPPPQILLPLEERVTHFRDMLLERGVRTLNNHGELVGTRDPGDPREGPVFPTVSALKLMGV